MSMQRPPQSRLRGAAVTLSACSSNSNAHELTPLRSVRLAVRSSGHGNRQRDDWETALVPPLRKICPLLVGADFLGWLDEAFRPSSQASLAELSRFHDPAYLDALRLLPPCSSAGYCGRRFDPGGETRAGRPDRLPAGGMHHAGGRKS